MYNPDDAAIETKKYLKKLKTIIENEATFIFFKTRLINKSRLDDILCCIEASFPDEYKDCIKRTGGKSLRSYRMYRELVGLIKRKSLLSSASYSVLFQEAINVIDNLSRGILSDYKRVYNIE